VPSSFLSWLHPSQFELYNNVLDFVIIIDQKSRILFLNASFIEHGVVDPRERLRGESLYSAFPSFADEGMPQYIETVLRDRQALDAGVIVHRTRRELIPTQYRLKLTPLSPRRGNGVGMIVLCFDWVGREERYAQFNDVLRQIIVHRIKMDASRAARGLNALVRRMREHGYNGGAQEETERLLNRLMNIVDTGDKVALVGRATGVLEPVELRSLVDQILGAKRAHRRDCTFNNDVPDDLSIVSSVSLLEECIGEFVQNACEAMEAKSSVSVGALPSDEIAGISIVNTGSRIPDKVLEHMLAGKALEPNLERQSTGLGVLMVKIALATYYNGKSHVEIANTVDGVRVLIRIPRVAEREGGNGE